MASLSANGLFEQVSKPLRLKRIKLEKERQMEKMWKVKEKEAMEYIALERDKFAKIKRKLSMRTRKFKVNSDSSN